MADASVGVMIVDALTLAGARPMLGARCSGCCTSPASLTGVVLTSCGAAEHCCAEPGDAGLVPCRRSSCHCSTCTRELIVTMQWVQAWQSTVIVCLSAELTSAGLIHHCLQEAEHKTNTCCTHPIVLCATGRKAAAQRHVDLCDYSRLLASEES